MMRTAEIRRQVWEEATGLLVHALDLEAAAGQLLELLTARLATRRARLILAGEDQSPPRSLAAVDLDPLAAGAPDVLEPDLLARLLRAGAPLAITRQGREIALANPPGAAELDRSAIAWLIAPVPLHGQAVGLIWVDRIFAPPLPLAEDLALLTKLAGLAGMMTDLDRQARRREAALRRANHCLRAELSERSDRFAFAGMGPAIQEVQRLAEKVAPSRATVLLVGEPGSGRGLVARLIHEHSARAGFPFLKLTCLGRPAEQIERALFGREPGADGQIRGGLLAQADGGTLFIDAITELGLPAQAKLLRLLQEREYEPAGGGRSRQVDVRLIAATSLDLARAVDRGLMREDLYYRLAVFPIALPPLRERGNDVGLLLEHFAGRCQRELGRRVAFTPPARDALMRYHWPGNLREMANLVERLTLLGGEGPVDLADLSPLLRHPASAQENAAGETAWSRLEELERREVVAALERNHWVQSHAARELGLTLRQIGYRIKKFGLEDTIRQQRRRQPAAPSRPRRPRRPGPDVHPLPVQPYSL